MGRASVTISQLTEDNKRLRAELSDEKSRTASLIGQLTELQVRSYNLGTSVNVGNTTKGAAPVAPMIGPTTSEMTIRTARNSEVQAAALGSTTRQVGSSATRIVSGPLSSITQGPQYSESKPSPGRRPVSGPLNDISSKLGGSMGRNIAETLPTLSERTPGQQTSRAGSGDVRRLLQEQIAQTKPLQRSGSPPMAKRKGLLIRPREMKGEHPPDFSCLLRLTDLTKGLFESDHPRNVHSGVSRHARDIVEVFWASRHTAQKEEDGVCLFHLADAFGHGKTECGVSKRADIFQACRDCIRKRQPCVKYIQDPDANYTKLVLVLVPLPADMRQSLVPRQEGYWIMRGTYKAKSAEEEENEFAPAPYRRR